MFSVMCPNMLSTYMLVYYVYPRVSRPIETPPHSTSNPNASRFYICNRMCCWSPSLGSAVCFLLHVASIGLSIKIDV